MFRFTPRATLPSDDAVRAKINELLRASEQSPGQKRRAATVAAFEQLTGSRLYGIPFSCYSGVATPDDVVYYLVLHMSKGGRTVLHEPGCREDGKCGCSTVQTYGSVSNALSDLRVHFDQIGHSGPYQPVTGRGNPADSPLVKTILAQIGLEQVRGGIEVSQGPALLGPELERIFAHIDQKTMERWPDGETTPTAPDSRELYLLLRDAAFLAIVAAHWTRSLDLANMRSDKITSNEEGSRLLSLRVTKTIRIPTVAGHGCVISVNTPFQACQRIGRFRAYGEAQGHDSVYLFPGFTLRGGMQNAPLPTHQMVGRLQKYAKEVNLDFAPSIKSLRIGGAVQAWLDGADEDELCRSGFWKTPQVALRYAQAHAARQQLRPQAKRVRRGGLDE